MRTRNIHKVDSYSPSNIYLTFVSIFQDISHGHDPRYEAAAELASRLVGSSTHPRTTQPAGGMTLGLAKKPKLKVPSADEAKRIAKIFGSQYSVPS